VHQYSFIYHTTFFIYLKGVLQKNLDFFAKNT